MNFKSWLILSENIIVKWQKDDAVLIPAKDVISFDFYYQWDKGHSEYFIGAFKAEKNGYSSIGAKSTHVGIIRNSPLHAGSGADYGFIKNLIQIIQKNGLKPIPYKEEGTFIDKHISNAEKEIGQKLDVDLVKTGFTTGQELPDFELGQSATHQLTKSVSVSRATGSWAQFFETIDATSLINKLVDFMEQAAKPLLDNDLLDFIEIINRKSGNHRTIYSSKGKKDSEDWKANNIKAVSQLKFYVDKYLTNAPFLKKELLKIINIEGSKNADKWFGAKAVPKDYALPLDKLFELNNNSYAEDSIIDAFLKAINNQDKIEQLEILSKNQNLDSVYYLKSYFWANEFYEDMFTSDNIFNYLINVYEIVVKHGKALKSALQEHFDYFLKNIKESLEEALSDKPFLSKNNIKYLSEIAPVIGLKILQ